MNTHRLCLIPLLLALTTSCATQHTDNVYITSNLQLWANGTHIFQHKVRFESTLFNLPAFDGLMRIYTDGQAPVIHVIGHGGLGLTLFNGFISPDEVKMSFLHPSLSRISNITQHITLCLRMIYFTVLPAYANRLETPDTADTEKEISLGFNFDGKSWSVTTSLEQPYPKTISFRNISPKYTVNIHLINYKITNDATEVKQ